MKYIKLFENFDTKSIDDICEEHGIRNYTINEDGSIDVNGNVNLNGRKLKKLPLKFGKVNGYFICSGNMLTSLEGCPYYVKDHFSCFSNNLTSLEGLPNYVGGSFSSGTNYIKTLIGLKTEIIGDYNFDPILNIIYEIIKDHLEYISNFYDYNIITDLDNENPTLNLKRLNRFIELYDLSELSEDQLIELKKYYNVI